MQLFSDPKEKGTRVWRDCSMSLLKAWVSPQAWALAHVSGAFFPSRRAWGLLSDALDPPPPHPTQRGQGPMTDKFGDCILLVK